MTPVVVRYRAEADIEKAKAWYARDDQQLGLQFALEVRQDVAGPTKVALCNDVRRHGRTRAHQGKRP